MLKIGAQRPVKMGDMWKLPPHMQSQRVYSTVAARWKESIEAYEATATKTSDFADIECDLIQHHEKT